MKANDFFRGLFNPFSRVAGWPALLLGLCIMALSSVVGYYSGAVCDGVLDVHMAERPETVTWPVVFLYPLISQACLVVVCSLMALVFTRNFRLLDLAGTLTLARAPFLLCLAAALFVSSPSLEEVMADPNALLQNGGFIAFLLLTILVEIWVVVLMVNAVRVSCDLKSGKLAGVVIMSVVVAEFIAKNILAHL